MATGRGVFCMSVAAALFFSPALAADAPPHSKPLTPVTVQPLPPVRAPEPQPAAAPRAQAAPTPLPAARPFWRRPEIFALLALVDTLAASASTFLYLRQPEPGRLRLAVALTASSGLFVAAALLAWLL